MGRCGSLFGVADSCGSLWVAVGRCRSLSVASNISYEDGLDPECCVPYSVIYG